MSYDTNGSLDRALELAKKRAMQYSNIDSETENGSSAKRHLGGGRDIHLKMLIPSNVSGHIIGKGGETIAELRRSSCTNIMMSKANELFPGTQDRVSLINGSKDSISDVVKLLVKLMKQRLEELGEPGDVERQLRLVVPNSTIGMVIGKGGETVEQMKQRSGSNILISKKDEVKIPERVITLVGEVRSNQVALDMILEKIVDDPNSSCCLNTSYEGVEGALGGNVSYTAARASASDAPGYDTINVNGHTNLRLTLNMLAPIPPDPWVSSQAMPHINYALRQAGHSDTVADELTRALGLLAAHGVLQLTQSAAKVEPAAQQHWAGETAQAQAAAQAYGASASYGSSYSSSYSSYAQPAAPQPQPPGSIKNYPPREKTPPGESSGPPVEEEVQVEERLVGAVLGPAGRYVEEIKQYSGADVQVSKRGIYAPGTTNRIVSVKGSQRAVKSAIYLVQAKVQEKQEERARSGRS